MLKAPVSVTHAGTTFPVQLERKLPSSTSTLTPVCLIFLSYSTEIPHSPIQLQTSWRNISPPRPSPAHKSTLCVTLQQYVQAPMLGLHRWTYFRKILDLHGRRFQVPKRSLRPNSSWSLIGLSLLSTTLLPTPSATLCLHNNVINMTSYTPT